MQVLTDPLSSLAQCLQAMLTAELTDNDGWQLLIKLAENLGYDDMKVEFETALENVLDSAQVKRSREEIMSSTMGQQTGFGTSQMNRESDSQLKHQHTEGTVARTIEQQTAKLPSDLFLWAAIGSIGTSAILRLMGKKNASLFVGDWVAPFMLFGVYNKIVKTQGSDRATRGH